MKDREYLLMQGQTTVGNTRPRSLITTIPASFRDLHRLDKGDTLFYYTTPFGLLLSPSMLNTSDLLTIIAMKPEA